MKSTAPRRCLCVALLILILCFIWGNSLLPGEASAAFSDWVKGLLQKLLHLEQKDEQGGGLLRKMAHFSEFAALGACMTWLAGMTGRKKVWIPLWGTGAACVDETIQCFVPNRGPSPVDVCIDVGGVLTGMVLLMAGYEIVKKLKFKE